MGKKRRQRNVGPQVAYPYPSRYGSHASMLVSCQEIPRSRMNTGWVVCEDERGKYATGVKKLDDGFHDPWRTCSIELRQEMMRNKFPYGVDVDED